MKLTSRDITHAWGRLKHHAVNAWTKSNKWLAAADAHVDVANRLFGATKDLLPERAVKGVGDALGSYASGRRKIDNARGRTEEIFSRLSGEVPELF